MTKHSYDKEFKEQAVQYYLDNKDHMTMNEISKNLGVLYAAYLFHIMYILDLNSQQNSHLRSKAKFGVLGPGNPIEIQELSDIQKGFPFLRNL